MNEEKKKVLDEIARIRSGLESTRESIADLEEQLDDLSTSIQGAEFGRPEPHPGPAETGLIRSEYLEFGFIPSRAEEVRQIQIVPSGLAIKSLLVEFRVKVGSYAEDNPEGVYSLIWLHRGPVGSVWRGNVLAYLNSRGARRCRVGTLTEQEDIVQTRIKEIMEEGREARIAVEIKMPGSLRLVKPLAEVYIDEVPYPFPFAGTGFLDTGKQGIYAIFGHPTTTKGPEEPTYGWRYDDLKVQYQLRRRELPIK